MRQIKDLKTVIVLLTLLVCSMSGFAQGKTLYVMKGGKVVRTMTVSGIDSVIFYNPTSPVITPSQDALFIYKASGSSSVKTQLDDVWNLSFSADKLSVKTRNSMSQQHDINDIKKLKFDDITGINFPLQDRFDVFAFFSPEGNLVVESPAIIQSLMLFGIDGKIIVSQKYNAAASVETWHAASLPIGVYFVRVETMQGTVVKKLLKH